MADCKTCNFENVCTMPDFVRNDLKRCKVYEEKKPQTNADRIRNMTDEELASIIMCPNEFNNCAIECYEYDDETCRECSLVWLQKEVE